MNCVRRRQRVLFILEIVDHNQVIEKDRYHKTSFMFSRIKGFIDRYIIEHDTMIFIVLSINRLY